VSLSQAAQRSLDDYITSRRSRGIMKSTLDLERRKIADFLAWLETNPPTDLTSVKNAPIVGVEHHTTPKEEHTMSETTQTEGTESPEVRAFWPTDYRRFAQVVRTARKDHGDTVADALATPIVDALSADFAGFDADRFITGTFQIPSYVGALASALKTGTHVKCQPWTPASDAKLAKVAALGADLTEVLSTQVSHFKAETFMESVKPPQPANSPTPSGYDVDDTDPDDDEAAF
jgi:hypothetical protein